MKTKYLIEIIDIRHPVEHTTSKKFHLFQEYAANPNSRLFLIKVRRRENELISDGKKVIEFK